QREVAVDRVDLLALGYVLVPGLSRERHQVGGPRTGGEGGQKSKCQQPLAKRGGHHGILVGRLWIRRPGRSGRVVQHARGTIIVPSRRCTSLLCYVAAWIQPMIPPTVTRMIHRADRLAILLVAAAIAAPTTRGDDFPAPP